MDGANRADIPNWIQQHSVYRDMMRLDVGDSTQVYAAFLVYMDLTEVRGWSEVLPVSCPELQAVLLEGREKDGDTVQIIYPLRSHRTIKHREYGTVKFVFIGVAQIERDMTSKYRGNTALESLSRLRCILDRGGPVLLCAVASDSSLVYQKLCDGFLTPDPPVDIKDQGRRQHRKRKLQT